MADKVVATRNLTGLGMHSIRPTPQGLGPRRPINNPLRSTSFYCLNEKGPGSQPPLEIMMRHHPRPEIEGIEPLWSPMRSELKIILTKLPITLLILGEFQWLLLIRVPDLTLRGLSTINHHQMLTQLPAVAEPTQSPEGLAVLNME
jgi:hypothetical protein